MPNLPPLPLVDGWLFIDNSFLDGETTCTRATEYSFLHKRVLAEGRWPLYFGGVIHSAFELRYIHGADQPSPEVERAQLDLIAKKFGERETPDGEHRTQSLATQITRFYNRKYITEPFDVLLDNVGKPMVEIPFAFPIGGPFDYGIKVMYMGRVDLSVLWNKQYFVIDHKTSFQLGKSFFEEQSMNAQHLGYCWGFKRTTGLDPAGYCVNAIRVRPPAETRDAVIDDDFQRHRYFITPERLVEWESNTCELIAEFLWHHHRDVLPMKTKWCVSKYGACPYLDICQLPPAHRPLMLHSNIYTDNDWSPLNKVKPSTQQTIHP